MADALQLARDAYTASTTYFDTNYRKKIEYGIRAFQNEHAPGSKYLSEDYRGRSKIFRPKTRSIIRKNEAAANIALFSNDDVIVVGAENPDDPYAVAGANLMKAVMQYRLTKTIPWFRVSMGALQDAQTVGACCSYNYWEHRRSGDGRIIKDEPCIKLRPLENLRFDAAADWLDPVNTSPYWIDVVPMFVCDVKAMMKMDGPQKWKGYDDEVIRRATPEMIDTTRRLRQGADTEDPFDQDRQISDYDIVWVFKVFMRGVLGDSAEDSCYYTLGNEALLTDPKPVQEVYFHGMRPYTFGAFVLEAHKVVPDGVAQLTRGLQQESNEIANQRLDNVKLVLNKRWFVARGRQVDTASLVRNVPGGVTLMNDPNMDVKESNWVDVTSSSYVEQDRLNADFDELAGNFSAGTKVANHAMNDTLGGSKLANQAASVMTEYGLRTWIETWVEPTLRQLMMLEQHYETDERVFALCGKKAQLWPRYGIYQADDHLLNQELTLTVNVGQGATDPQQRMTKFMAATQAAMAFVQNAPPGFNVQEMVKEVYSYAGFRDGSRFMPGQTDPRLILAFQKIQQLQAEVQSNRYQVDMQARTKLAEIAAEKKAKDDEIRVNAARIDLDADIRRQEVGVANKEVEAKVYATNVQAEITKNEQQLKIADTVARAADMDERTATERSRIEVDRQARARDQDRADREEMRAERETVATEQNEARITQVAQQVSQALDGVVSQVGELKQSLVEVQKTADKVNALQDAMLQMAQTVTTIVAQPKPRGYKKRVNQDGKKSFIIVMDDGTEREMGEQ